MIDDWGVFGTPEDTNEKTLEDLPEESEESEEPVEPLSGLL